jgi:hypothetical protein
MSQEQTYEERVALARRVLELSGQGDLYPPEPMPDQQWGPELEMLQALQLDQPEDYQLIPYNYWPEVLNAFPEDFVNRVPLAYLRECFQQTGLAEWQEDAQELSEGTQKALKARLSKALLAEDNRLVPT